MQIVPELTGDDPAEPERRSEGAPGQQPAWQQGYSDSTSAAGPVAEAYTKEAAYARMQALLAERNGLPPLQSSVAAPATLSGMLLPRQMSAAEQVICCVPISDQPQSVHWFLRRLLRSRHEAKSMPRCRVPSVTELYPAQARLQQEATAAGKQTLLIQSDRQPCRAVQMPTAAPLQLHLHRQHRRSRSWTT